MRTGAFHPIRKTRGFTAPITVLRVFSASYTLPAPVTPFPVTLRYAGFKPGSKCTPFQSWCIEALFCVPPSPLNFFLHSGSLSQHLDDADLVEFVEAQEKEVEQLLDSDKEVEEEEYVYFCVARAQCTARADWELERLKMNWSSCSSSGGTGVVLGLSGDQTGKYGPFRLKPWTCLISNLVLPERRKSRKASKSPARPCIAQWQTIHLSEPEEVLEVTAEVRPRTRIDDMQVCIDVRAAGRYQDTEACVHVISDGAEVVINNLFKCLPDITKWYGWVADSLREMREMDGHSSEWPTGFQLVDDRVEKPAEGSSAEKPAEGSIFPNFKYNIQYSTLSCLSQVRSSPLKASESHSSSSTSLSESNNCSTSFSWASTNSTNVTGKGVTAYGLHIVVAIREFQEGKCGERL
ncbi:hypothetical protein FB451DRAFT_1176038 [Mycena latifolia]|nr:hypothetical protein FB451DRAFT_1176038 [Mycena latifolia]